MVDAPSLLRAHRLAAGLSQRELARRAGTSSATLHRYESGAIDPSTATLNRILRACLPRRRRVASLAALAPQLARSLVQGGAEVWRLVGEFLDDDRGAGIEEFRLSVADPPPASGDPRADALVAALAEHLAGRRGVAAPPWAQAVVELTPWWFPAGEAFRAMALRESPPSFARRGIFLTAGALERV